MLDHSAPGLAWARSGTQRQCAGLSVGRKGRGSLLRALAEEADSGVTWESPIFLRRSVFNPL